mgnify:CR=1 FL=1
MSRDTPHPNFSDGVGRLACPPEIRDCPVPLRDDPADAASVITPEVIYPDRQAAAEYAGDVLVQIFVALRHQRRQVIDVESVACVLLPLAALPSAGVTWAVLGFVIVLLAGFGVLLLFMPRRPRMADPREATQVPCQSDHATSGLHVVALDRFPGDVLIIEPSRESVRLAQSAGSREEEAAVLLKFREVSDVR